jgi:hypothetical protein
MPVPLSRAASATYGGRVGSDWLAWEEQQERIRSENSRDRIAHRREQDMKEVGGIKRIRSHPVALNDRRQSFNN